MLPEFFNLESCIKLRQLKVLQRHSAVLGSAVYHHCLLLVGRADVIYELFC